MTITIPASPSSYTLSASGTTASNAGTRGQSGGGPSVGIYLQGSNDTLVNTGTILGGSANSNLDIYGGVGVKNGTGDSVTNQAGGLIENTYSIGAGIVFYLTAGTITNAGRLIGGLGSVGHSGNGVDLFAGGSVTNLSTGTISGGGVFDGTRGVAGTVTNSGQIIGDSVYGGIYLAAGGVITNLAGTIAANGGSYGIKLAGAAGTITNAATITSGSVGGTAILMAAVIGNRVIDQTGGVFVGTVNGGSNATMELASSASAGTLTATSSQFTNFSSMYIDSGAAWTIKGDSSLSSEFPKIGGFAVGDTISLTGLAQTPTTFSSSTAVNAGTTTTSVVIKAGSTGLETLTLLGSIASSQFSFTAGTTSTLTETAAAPVITAGATATFNGGGAAVVADSGLTVTDAGSSTLASATVSIGGFITGDTLTVGTLGGLTPAFSDGTLTLTGTASLATYETALDSVDYGFAAGDDPTGGGSHTSRTLSWTVNDGTSVSNTGTSTVDVVHTAPTVAAGGSVTFVQGGSAVTLDPGLTVTDPDSGGDLNSAVIKVSGGVFSTDGDTLAANTGGTSISASYTQATETLSLTGTDTLADYQAVLRSITLSSNGATAGTRTIDWAVDDGVANSATATSSATVHDAPVVTSGGTVTFNGGGAAVVADSGLTVTDASSTTAASATVVIGGFISGDTLTVGTLGGLTPGFNNGTLTLSGTAPLATYRTALDSVEYGFAANDDPTGGGSHTSRTLSWSINDGTVVSNTGTSTVDTVHTAPTVVAGASPSYVAGGAAVALDSTLTVSDPDSGGDLARATVAISSGLLSGDSLNFTNQGGISGSFNSGTLTLTGTATLNQYQTALESITYSSGNPDPADGNTDTSRTITWSVNDGVVGSAPVTSTVHVDTPPSVVSIDTVQASSNSGGTEQFAVVFSESVTGVDTSDFTLADTGSVSGTINSISGSGSSYTATVTGASGSGTMGLDLKSSGTGITDAAGNGPSGGFTSGETYTITPASGAPSISAPATATIGVNKAHAIGTVTIAESPITGGETFTLVLSDNNGVLAASTGAVGGGGSITPSNAGKTLTVFGTLAQVNADLTTLTDDDPTTPSDTVSYSLSDSDGGNATPASTAVTVNSAPSISVPGPVTVDQGSATAVAGVSVAEGGDTTTSGETFTVAVSDGVGVLSATTGASGGGGTITPSNSSMTQTIVGTLTQVNADLTTLTDDDASIASDTISVTASDSFGNSASGQTISVSVASASGTPSISAPAAATVGVGQPGTVGPVTIAELPTLGGETFTLTLSDSHGVLSANNSAPGGGGTIAPSNGGDTLTISGTLAQVNADLTTLADDDGSTPSDTISYGLSDSNGGTATAASTAVTVNSAPVISAPGSATVAQNVATGVTPITVGETGNTTTSGETFSVVVSDGAGTLSATSSGGSVASSNGGLTLTITGTLQQVNADLATLTDDDASTAPDTITVTATDSFGNSTAIATTIPVTVTPAGPTTAIFDAHVYDDVNVDGIQDTGDTNAAGITVNLLDGFGNPTGTTAVTDSNGNVSFTGLTPGSYEIGVLTPAGDGVTQATNLNTPNTLTAGQTANATEGFYVAPALTDATLDLTVAEGMSLGNIWSELVANGIDPNPASLTITAVGTSGTQGSVTLNAGADSLVYVATGFNPSNPVDVFTYTLKDGSGGTVTGTVDVTVTGPTLPTTVDTTPGSTGSVSGSGQRLISGGAGQTLNGSAAGGDDIFGGSDTSIAAAGSGNNIYVTPGNHTIAMGANNNTLTLYDGNNTVTATGTGNTVTGGNGNNHISGMTGSATITLGNGNDSVTVTGANNKITVGTGTDTISAGSGGNETVVAGDGANTITGGGANGSFTTGNGVSKITATGADATIVGGNGGVTVLATGAGDGITTGSGNDSIQVTAGSATIKAGLGVNTIKFAGSSNDVINQGGTDTLTDTGTNNTIGLPLAGQGLDTTNGSVMTNGDTFDLRAALGATTWDQQIGDLGSYLTLGTSGSNTLVQLSVTSGGTPITIAVLNGQGAVSLSSFTSHSLLT